MIVGEKVRHQVAVAGRVTDAVTGGALRGARVEITAAPAAFTDWLAIHKLQFQNRWEKLDQRPDRTLTAADGHFHFLDLPAGPYTLTSTLAAAGRRYREEATVEVLVGENGELATADLALTPTTLAGRVSGPDGGAVVMAEVRIAGSGEKSFTDGEGSYRLVALEAGERTVGVAAQGFAEASQAVTLERGATHLLDLVLEAALTGNDGGG